MSIKETKVLEDSYTRVCQGDILNNIKFIDDYTLIDKQIEISYFQFPLVYVLTQDCDLEQECKECIEIVNNPNNISNLKKRLFSVLVAPLYNSEHFMNGEHLSEIISNYYEEPLNKCSSPRIESRKENEYIKNNHRYRYHCIKFEPDTGLGEYIIDFAHYFTVNLKSLMKAKSLMEKTYQVAPLYREEISLRFSQFLSRIGFP